MNLMKNLMMSLLVFFLFFSSETKAKEQREEVKNLILFIGDGMGPQVVNATRLQFLGLRGTLNIDRFPYTAKVKTSSADEWVTDSAAAATAMVTGHKTLNGALSMTRDSEKPSPTWQSQTTLLEYAVKQKKRVGLVTTTSILDATPAAFFAHVDDRKKKEEILNQLLLSPVSVIMGGGWDELKTQEKKIKENFVLKREIFPPSSCPSPKEKLMGVFAPDSLPSVMSIEDKKEKNKELKLTKLTELALECLTRNNTQGFLLMVESEDIDESLHNREIPQALYAAKELDAAVSVAQKWLTKKNLDQNTLVLVTADHDTAGLSVSDPVPHTGLWKKEEKGNQSSDKRIIPLVKGSKYSDDPYPVVTLATNRVGVDIKSKAPHTSTDVDIYASGPQADQFHGTMENTEIFHIIKRIFLTQ